MQWFRPGGSSDGARVAGTVRLRAPHAGGIELSQLGRYGMVVAVIAASALLAAWSRVDLVEISGQLGAAEARVADARADRARLLLEFATLTDPSHLAAMSESLALDASVPLVNVPAGASVR